MQEYEAGMYGKLSVLTRDTSGRNAGGLAGKIGKL